MVMSMQEQKRSLPLSDLEKRAMALTRVGGSVQSYLIEIAATRSPSAVYGLAFHKLLNCGHSRNGADRFARAARYLAIIKRDYGEEAFGDVVRKIRAD